jgi:transcriptional regulator with PAS, ATPase and Fis domain
MEDIVEAMELAHRTPELNGGIIGTEPLARVVDRIAVVSVPVTPPSSPTIEIERRKLVYDEALSNSVRMRAVKEMIDRVAATDATVLVWGDSGVGKEMVARALHQKSPRRDRPFVKVNCAALPLELLESELFGYERGAFTGAHRQKPGKFEVANTGTIFLDEVGEMPMPLQAKLLQVLQDREFSRLGSRHDIRVDVRVIAATNKDLGKLVERGAFREDLYYRLNVVNIHVPPLRDRREEIPILVEHFVAEYARQYNRTRQRISPATMRMFMNYAWPGNVRELENIVKRIVLLGTEDWVLQELAGHRAQIPEPSLTGPYSVVPALPAPESVSKLKDGLTLKDIARRAALDAERAAIKEVLDVVHWNRLEAARRLKVSYKTLRRKIQECGLED